MYLCLGGTFWPLHRGHDHLLNHAIERADKLLIGLTTDRYAAETKERTVAPYDEREQGLRERVARLVRESGRDVEFTIRPLDGPLGTSPPMDEVEGIVLSRDMQGLEGRLQEMRMNAGQKPFTVFYAEELLAEDGRPIRASRVQAGEIDGDGKVLKEE